MRNQLLATGGLTLDHLLRFKTIKSISTDKALLARAAKGECTVDGAGERLKQLIAYNDERGEATRVVAFDWKTMGDGSKLSLYVKNVPVTKKEEKKEEEVEGGDKTTEGGETKEEEPFRPRYAASRDEIKALFEPYGQVGIVTLRYDRRQSPHPNASEADEQYMNPSHRGYNNSRGGESCPAGKAIVEFDSVEGMDAACKDLLISVDAKDAKRQAKKEDGDGDEGEKKEEEAAAGTKVLELKGNKLVIEKMRPVRNWKNKGNDNSNGKRSRDSVDGNNGDANGAADAKDFEPITLEWEKGCVISVTGLSAASCDRESIRDAVSNILGVSTDVKESGLYVDYSRGDTDAKLRLKEANPDKMKELVDKLVDGSVTFGGEKVESASILEGEDEEKYWKNFIVFLNNRKRQRDEEKAQTRKRQKFGGGRGGRGRGRGRRD